MGQSLDQLVGNVAGIERGEHQHVGAAGRGVPGHLALRYLREKRCISLQFTRHRQARRLGPEQRQRLAHALDAGPVRTPHAAVRQECHLRDIPNNPDPVGRRRARDIR